MKVLIATAFLFSLIAAQEYTEEPVDANPWTGRPGVIRYAKQCEQPAGQPRGKRQATSDFKNDPNCFFHADDSITPSDCNGYCSKDAHRTCKALNGTSAKYTCTKKPVFVPLGKFDICDRFPDNFNNNGKIGPWFNTVGSNYGCSSAQCCLWFPPSRCADVPLVKYTFLPFTDNSGITHNDCSNQQACEDNSLTAAEINIGRNGQEKQICIFQQVAEDENGEPIVEFKEETVKFSDCEPSYSPAAGCCKFTPLRRN